jgi:pilus assembly protein CpaE
MIGESDRLQILSTNGALQNNVLPSNAGIEKLVDLSRQMADVVILDLPHIWNTWMEDFSVLADEFIITACLDLANLRDAKSIFELLKIRRGEGREARLVVNKADMAKRGRLTLQDATRALAVKPTATIPFDPVNFSESVNDGKVLSERSKAHKASTAFYRLATEITGHQAGKSARRSLNMPNWLARGKTRSVKA